MTSKPPPLTVVALAVPPASIAARPPDRMVPPISRPYMVSKPPLTVVALAVPPETIVAAPPD
jgi:hypothetical protein